MNKKHEIIYMLNSEMSILEISEKLCLTEDQIFDICPEALFSIKDLNHKEKKES